MGSLQGSLATEKQKDRHSEYSKLLSVGRLFHEPIWVFTRGDLPIASLRDLKGKRIMIGTRDSGARGVARQLLKANGVIERKTRPSLIRIFRPMPSRCYRARPMPALSSRPPIPRRSNISCAFPTFA